MMEEVIGIFIVVVIVAVCFAMGSYVNKKYPSSRSVKAIRRGSKSNSLKEIIENDISGNGHKNSLGDKALLVLIGMRLFK